MVCSFIIVGCSSDTKTNNQDVKITVPEGYVAITAPKDVETITVDQVTYQLFDDMTAVIQKGELAGEGDHFLWCF